MQIAQQVKVLNIQNQPLHAVSVKQIGAAIHLHAAQPVVTSISGAGCIRQTRVGGFCPCHI